MQTNGLPILVDWGKFKVGSSFYVPTLEPDKLLNRIRKYCRKMGMGIRGKRTVEGKTMGVRIWRVR